MRYSIACRFCKVSANATDLHGLGSQLNAHSAICLHEPTVVISEEQVAGEFAVETVSKGSKTQSSKLLLVSNCA